MIVSLGALHMWRVGFCFLALSQTACAGLFFEGSLATLPALGTPSDASNAQVAWTYGASLGLEFDVERTVRLAGSFAWVDTKLSTGSAGFAAPELRVDGAIFRFGEDTQLRVGGGITGSTLTRVRVSELDRRILDDVGGIAAYGGFGVSRWLAPRLALHSLLTFYFLREATPGGIVQGVGPGLRLALSLQFGDTRVDSTARLARVPSSRWLGILEVLRKRGCDVTSFRYGERPFLRVLCPDTPEVLLYRDAAGIGLRCPKSESATCLQIADTLRVKLGY